MYSSYEKHDYPDPAFPFRFHLDKRTKTSRSHPRWHEPVELLYVTEGICDVYGNGIKVRAKPGNIVLITPNCVHCILTESETCSYYCITAEKEFCDGFGAPVCSGQFALVVTDAAAVECYQAIIDLMIRRPKYYQIETKALVLRLIAQCCRVAGQSAPTDSAAPHSLMVTKAMDYLSAHCCEPVTVDELCRYLGFSKYYLCRSFKAMTGRTIVDYLNFLRCNNARRLICSGQYNVGESARLSGFNNMSYFARTYQRQMGCKPSQSQNMQSL